MSGRPTTLSFDTPLWIHWFDENAAFLPAISPLMLDLREGRVVVATSVLSVLEVLTGAFVRKDDVLARRYSGLFEATEGVVVLDVDREIAERAARLRARYRLRTPDAVHVGTALTVGASAFVTTDRRLAGIREIEVRVLRPARPSRGRG